MFFKGNKYLIEVTFGEKWWADLGSFTYSLCADWRSSSA